ncbi:hypothetical protein [Paenibacillus koleovorans]|uniref:hypothetical protein n=1 Tax=Paenibacillus koleovorans TaxID=121608 RepID=UPI000FD7F28C|nr:hypothetical protein [Paenibacillus koleovorans]
MRPYLKLQMILPGIQALLTLVAVLVDRSVNQGLGEGPNQVQANLISNVEFFIKGLLGYDDIVNYNFRPVTVMLAIGFWYLVGLALNRLLRKRKGSIHRGKVGIE